MLIKSKGSKQVPLLPPKLRNLFFRQQADGSAAFIPSRSKVAYGGRGSGKSWGFASVLSILTSEYKLRALCVREYQNSIQESVHALLEDRIDDMGLNPRFDVQKSSIYSDTGSQIDFAGVRSDPAKIKSAHGYDILFIEEAEKISKASWRVLPATIRDIGSEIWVVFNQSVFS
jgi:phage terminase large subunit